MIYKEKFIKFEKIKSRFYETYTANGSCNMSGFVKLINKLLARLKNRTDNKTVDNFGTILID